MVSWGDVQKWDPPGVAAVVDALTEHCGTLAGLNDEIETSGTPREWRGEAAHAAASNLGQLTQQMEKLVAGVGAIKRGGLDAEVAIEAVKRAIDEADGLAAAHDFVINDLGQVYSVSATPSDQLPDDIVRERARVQAEIVDRVEQILRRATDVDADLSALMGRVMRGEIGEGADSTTLAQAAAAGATQGELSVVGPPEGGSPGDNAGWWDSLSKGEQEQILAEHPEWIGNLDGVPFGVRDAANRLRFDDEYARLKDLEARLQAELDGNTFGGHFSNADAGLAMVQAKLQSMDRIGEVMSLSDRQVLTLDMSSERAEAAIAVGNVDTADHVAVFTPGLTSTVDGSLGDYDTAMENMRKRATDQLDAAGRSDETVATVTWIGYQAPQMDETFVDANSVTDRYAADRGAEKLAPFLNGIDTARDGDAHLTTLGHSYGSTTTGIALQQGTGADEAVFFGSPGLDTRDVDNLQVPDGHSYYIEGRLDPVGDLGHFGPDPSRLDGMRQLSAAEANGPDGPMSESAWHSYYLEDNSTSQYNMAAAMVDIPGNMIDAS